MLNSQTNVLHSQKAVSVADLLHKIFEELTSSYFGIEQIIIIEGSPAAATFSVIVEQPL
jgi:hypothetical protein